MTNEIAVLDLFSGIGGFTKGIEDAGFTIKEHFFSEINKHAIANYQYNFPHAQNVGSVTNIQSKQLPRINIITFGSPCQDFSLAGKGQGLEGKRSNLIRHAIRLINELQPEFFIWENVKGVFSSNNSQDFWAIIQAFTDIGPYRIEWQLLNTAWILPQNRERIYLVGHLATTERSFKQIFPIQESDCLNFARITTTQAKNQNTLCLTAKGQTNQTGSFIKQLNSTKDFAGVSTKQQNRVYDTSGIMATLSAHRGENKCTIITTISQ